MRTESFLEKLKSYRIFDYDFKLVLMLVALSIIGVIAVGSADPTYKSKQIAGLVLGLFMMVLVSLMDYLVIIKFYVVYYIINIFFLSLVFTPLGKSVKGATRWIDVGVVFQPSEASKILLILFFAAFIMKYKERVKKIYFIFICFGLLAPPLLMIVMQPDLSTTIMLTVIISCILFSAGINMKFVITVLAISIPSALLVIFDALADKSILLREYQQSRILAWLHPEDYANSDAYQTLNSMMAIGSGQLLGKGYNTNEITSVLNGGFVSESQTDFIFTVVGEEFGFIGGLAVIALLLLIAVECFVIAGRSKDLAGQLIATGMGAWIGFQGFLNIGVATGALPNTGIPLPFVSAGLTSLVSCYIGMGFVLNVRLQGKKYF
ncbi:FtsW/RodA/SpoVE family cell cycle protein [Butyrivibrio sp. LC3010]|uniref:FtsW/RodA/SpoVE family cell cycle protein n=1 Tax=Butyrivibrio sp. LC3010 TaxID=1280680 RepID=UPI00040B6F29|nr:FtsW/RodA/SpoVE family cell cycle protein [Butyrivibrio sp. LC3010]